MPVEPGARAMYSGDIAAIGRRTRTYDHVPEPSRTRRASAHARALAENEMSAPHEENRGQEGGQSAAPAPAEAAHPLDGDLVAGGNLDKIRTILFGAQARDYERRFVRLEERVAKESSDIRDEVRRRFDALESGMKRELESLADRLRAEEAERSAALRDLGAQLKDTARSLQDRIKSEQNERGDAVKELSGELHNASSGLDRRIAQLSDQTSRADRELRDALGEQNRMLADELRSKSEELWAALSRSVNELRSEKTDRAALASMLSELAMRLNDEFKFSADE
jgi:gas vesicle protein